MLEVIIYHVVVWRLSKGRLGVSQCSPVTDSHLISALLVELLCRQVCFKSCSFKLLGILSQLLPVYTRQQHTAVNCLLARGCSGGVWWGAAHHPPGGVAGSSSEAGR